MYREMLVAVNRNERAEGIVRHAQGLGEAGATRMTLLYVGRLIEKSVIHNSRVVDPGERMLSLGAQAGAELMRLAAQPRRSGFMVDTLVRFGDVADEIVQVAEERRADVIVLGTVERGAWTAGRRLVDRVMRRARCAVILVRPAPWPWASAAGARSGPAPTEEVTRRSARHQADQRRPLLHLAGQALPHALVLATLLCALALGLQAREMQVELDMLQHSRRVLMGVTPLRALQHDTRILLGRAPSGWRATGLDGTTFDAPVGRVLLDPSAPAPYLGTLRTLDFDLYDNLLQERTESVLVVDHPDDGAAELGALSEATRLPEAEASAFVAGLPRNRDWQQQHAWASRALRVMLLALLLSLVACLVQSLDFDRHANHGPARGPVPGGRPGV